MKERKGQECPLFKWGDERNAKRSMEERESPNPKRGQYTQEKAGLISSDKREDLAKFLL